METRKKNRGDPLPPDMIFDILTRLPVKSLLRFRCVSNLWSSIISEQYFLNSHMTRSLTRPSVLILLSDEPNHYRLLFSAPYPQDAKETSPLMATHHMSLPRMANSSYYISESLNGLILFGNGFGSDIRICNPSTREVIKYNIRDYSWSRKFFFGFDPVKNEHKVLIERFVSINYKQIIDNWVFSLSANSWRRIEDAPPHIPLRPDVCINGTLYYREQNWRNDDVDSHGTIVAFDVGLEKFRLISTPLGSQLFRNEVVLTQFEGCLGVIDYSQLRVDDRLDLWVLEDSHNGVWSKKSFIFPSSWKETVGEKEFNIPGIIHGGEIMLAPRYLSKPFYLFYFDMKRNCFRKVEIQGLPDGPDHEFLSGSTNFGRLMISNHVESLLSLAHLNN